LYVSFVDLVKAYDTANHALLIDILRKYGVPSKFTTTVETIYRNNTCVLQIENKIREIPRTVGVRQGDNMAPVLFLFLMTAFAETLEIVWAETLEIVWKERDPILCVCVCVCVCRDLRKKGANLYVRDTNRKDGPPQHLRRHNPSRLLTSASPWVDVS
jgi:hypothetical protein